MRRRSLAMLFGLLMVTALVACGPDTAESDGEGGWTYVSGDGETYTAEEVPTRIIAHAYSAKVLMEFGIIPVGVYADGPIASDVGLQGVDFSGIEILGEEWGVIDVGKAAELDPDLIVADWWPVEGVYSGFEEGVEDESRRLADLGAPVVGASQGDSIVDLIEGYARLAESLGADSELVEQQRAAFEEAVAAFEEATAAKPGLTALAISPWDADYYVAVPQYAPELLDFQSWGLNVIDPDSPDEGFPYWETVSMENADKYQPDILLFDDRNYPGNKDTLDAQPIAGEIAAYAAGAYTTWPAYWLHTYSDYTDQLQVLTAFIQGADENIGSE